MYYESMMHQSWPVASAAAAATILHNHKDENGKALADFHALVFVHDDAKFAVVADNHIDNPWFEVAVINLDRMQQIESLTMGWVETLDRKIALLVQAVTGSFSMGPVGTARLPLDGEGGDFLSWWECACCGTSYQSTYDYEKKFDQDNNHGFCPRCELDIYQTKKPKFHEPPTKKST